jgi:hypothetical protein
MAYHYFNPRLWNHLIIFVYFLLGRPGFLFSGVGPRSGSVFVVDAELILTCHALDPLLCWLCGVADAEADPPTAFAIPEAEEEDLTLTGSDLTFTDEGVLEGGRTALAIPEADDADMALTGSDLSNPNEGVLEAGSTGLAIPEEEEADLFSDLTSDFLGVTVPLFASPLSIDEMGDLDLDLSLYSLSGEPYP